MQMVFQIIAAFFQDSHADALRNDPVLTAVDMQVLASQTTLSRFLNRMDTGAFGRDTEDFQETSLLHTEAGARSIRSGYHVVPCLWPAGGGPLTFTIRLTATIRWSASTVRSATC